MTRAHPVPGMLVVYHWLAHRGIGVSIGKVCDDPKWLDVLVSTARVQDPIATVLASGWFGAADDRCTYVAPDDPRYDRVWALTVAILLGADAAQTSAENAELWL